MHSSFFDLAFSLKFHLDGDSSFILICGCAHQDEGSAVIQDFIGTLILLKKLGKGKSLLAKKNERNRCVYEKVQEACDLL